MSGCLIDTNVLSELRKGQRCDAGVRQWFEETAEEELFISVLVLTARQSRNQKMAGRRAFW
jgi:predicted nucleic acid-binding protein